jgi:hypothetical protein
VNKKGNLKNYRQGDIIILGITEIPYSYSKPILLATNVIREGEISGHKHEVKNGKLYEMSGKIYIEADRGCQVIHPEHKPIHLPKGKYEINIQREYDEAKDSKKVKD